MLDNLHSRLQGDAASREAAVAELREVLLRGLRRAFIPRGKDDAFCEDVTQDALLQIIDKIEQFQGRSKFTTWAIAIAVRLGVSELRRKHYKDVSINTNADEGMRVDLPTLSATENELVDDQSSILTKLKTLIDANLTDKQRSVVNMVLQGLPIEEIACRMESNRNAIYKVFHDARKRLKAGFEEAGYQATDIAAAFDS
ncbi:MAG: RNA polymerase sigma factor (sigma-70 family) [Pirellulaceae bacterium]|jgi:RNA polymerase sigma factor (sigma-70 family)